MKRVAIAVFTLIAGVAILWVGLAMRGTAVRGRDWPTAPGHIVERGVTKRINSSWYYPRARYTYEVAGKSYTGERVYQTGRLNQKEAAARQLVDALPDPVPVHYDPASPGDAFLIASPSWTYWVAIAMGALALLVGAIQALALLTARA